MEQDTAGAKGPPEPLFGRCSTLVPGQYVGNDRSGFFNAVTTQRYAACLTLCTIVLGSAPQTMAAVVLSK